MTAVPIGSELSKAAGATVWSPSYEISFTYGGNNYSFSALAIENAGTEDSSVTDSAMQTMVGALGTGYTNVKLYQVSTNYAELI